MPRERWPAVTFVLPLPVADAPAGYTFTREGEES
jgi:hypothetical protein